ncbi:glycerol-3-phosphate dehydrogenase/oxidase [bacterium]|nr:MAG: glycerol-3-phosphate dehydrogenase/oxidase [bacterium]
MQTLERREQTWQRLHQPWDVLVIGGGITGAGVLMEAARRGLRAALVERGDFACGASSRSSKLVHGGLRYLKDGRIGLTRESVREREALLREAPGLVEPLSFVTPHYRGRKPGRASIAAGLLLYDLLAGHRSRRYLDARHTLEMVPALDAHDLTGAHLYGDASTDDARLVMRVLHEAVDAGASALNYVCADGLARRGGRVAGAVLRDVLTGRHVEVEARVVINAAGPAADRLRAETGAPPALRPLRGSHLLLPDWRLPLAQAVAFFHPHDGRPVFAYPWCDAILVGTTDLDHRADPLEEASISSQEAAYLIAALHHQFPRHAIERRDVIATFSGVRPVLVSGKADPSRESRDHLILREQGMVTVTGGKLTTFRPMALAALRAARDALGTSVDLEPRPIFSPAVPPQAPGLTSSARLRLSGRYGSRAQAVIDAAQAGELESIEGSRTLWCELRWAARAEDVTRLDDLLLRRTRIGLLLRDGAARWLPRVREICSAELNWDDARWEREEAAYRAHWQRYHALRFDGA